jgi:hypothetical protein
LQGDQAATGAGLTLEHLRESGYIDE